MNAETMETKRPSIEECVKRWFGHTWVRPGKLEAIEAVSGGRDVVMVMPTGAGKSSCCQLAAPLLSGTVLEISPLIVPMKNLVDMLTRKGIAVTCFNSFVVTEAMDKRFQDMVVGKYKLVYVSPECFHGESFCAS